jgi:hypothetical protein
VPVAVEATGNSASNSGSTRAGRRRLALSNIRETRRLNKEKQVWAALSTLETDSK